jgi:hypothetical protein
MVHNDLGLPVLDRQGYRRTPEENAFIDHIRSQTTFTATPRPGDIAIFRQERFPCHTAIFGDDEYGRLTIIHAYATEGKVVEEVFDHQWVRQLVEARQFNGLSD